MDLFLILAFLFCIGSFIGWGLEVLYRKRFDDLNPEHKWINPGFLRGPYLPLYGMSLIILFLLARIEPYLGIKNQTLCKLTLFVVMAVCITAVEYFTGLIFIVKLKMKLWDYSNNRFNIKGIICPLYSFFWMLLSALYYFVIDPRIIKALTWLSENLAFSFVIGFFYGVFVIDLANSIKESIKIYAFAHEEKIVVIIDEFRRQVEKYRELKKQKPKFFDSFHSPETMQEYLKYYKQKASDRLRGKK